MKLSSMDDVKKMYEDTADAYSKMMDAEIELPMYADTLGRLSERIQGLTGSVVDTACGSGHMLHRYHTQYDSQRPLIGIDLSANMVAISSRRLGGSAKVYASDMGDLKMIDTGTAAAVINYFALHHVAPESALPALAEWHRILCPNGQLTLATWEGEGVIDYGEVSDIVALRYTETELRTWVEQTGFKVTRCVTEPVEDFPMQAIYLEAQKQ